jgi:signal transduction histidine kinase
MAFRMIVLTDEVRDCLTQVGEALDDALLLVDRHGVVHLSNRTARGLLDLAGDGVTLGAAGGQWQNELLALLRRFPAGGAATEIHVAGGAPLVLEAYAVERDGEFWGGMFVVRSAAVRRRDLQASRASEFAYEVKNALHPLLLNVYMLRKWTAAQPYVETQTLAKFDVVTGEIHRLNGLAEGFLPDARPRIRREAVHLSQLLGDAVSRLAGLARESGIEIRARLPGDLPPLQGDTGLLVDAFGGLLENRLQALGEGGELEVQAGVGGKHVFVVVTDNGPGLSYASPEPAGGEGNDGRGGRGLGVTEWVVRGHGGSFEAFSAAGLGNTFVVKLPLSGMPPTVAEPDLRVLRDA